MAVKWETVEVSKIAKRAATGPFGSAISSKHFLSDGVPVIRGSNLSQDVSSRLIDEGLVYVSEEKAEEFARSEARKGDLVFTSWGTIDQVGLIDERARYDRYIVSNKQMLLTPDPTRVDSLFLYYYFSSPEIRAEIVNQGIGSSVPGFNLGQLRNFRVLLPPLPEQKAIAAVLGALDDKIELNRRMNATLEAIARALFQSWFVNFDPVRVKAEGRSPAGLDKPTADLFPAQFRSSELGEIPKGWSVIKVGDFIERLPVGQKYEQKTVSPVGNVPVLDQGKSGVIGFHNNQPGVKASLDKPVAVFANHTCYMRLITFPFSAIQNVLPFVGKGVDTLWAFYATEGRLAFSEYKGHWPDFVIQETTMPPRELTVEFGRLVKPLVTRIRNNDEESRTLATLRDALMPKLLNGELSPQN